jgi:hypothetical protein
MHFLFLGVYHATAMERTEETCKTFWPTHEVELIAPRNEELMHGFNFFKHAVHMQPIAWTFFYGGAIQSAACASFTSITNEEASLVTFQTLCG